MGNCRFGAAVYHAVLLRDKMDYVITLCSREKSSGYVVMPGTDFATKRNLDPVFGFDGLLCGCPGILLAANTVQRSGRRMVPADDADSPPYGREQYF